jgi:hypothetical protein
LADPDRPDLASLPQVASEIMALFLVTDQERLANEQIARQLGKEERNVNKVVRRLISKGLLAEEPQGLYTYYFVPKELRLHKIEERVIDNYLSSEWPSAIKTAPPFLKRVITKAWVLALQGLRKRLTIDTSIPGKHFRHQVDLLVELDPGQKRNMIVGYVFLADKMVKNRVFQFAGEYSDVETKNIRAVKVISIGSLQNDYWKYLESIGTPGLFPSIDVVEISKGTFADIILQLKQKLAM